MIEYEKSEEAQNAIKAMNGAELLTQNVSVDWAFSSGPNAGSYRRKNLRFVSYSVFLHNQVVRVVCYLDEKKSSVYKYQRLLIKYTRE